MTHYLIHFNQQWVGDHSAEWFEGRGPLARAVVEEMKSAGVLVFAGGLVEEIETAWQVDPDGSQQPGPYKADEEFVGGLTIINVATEAEAHQWASKIGVACGWPQEVRAFKS